jgi:hypothetical protein
VRLKNLICSLIALSVATSIAWAATRHSTSGPWHDSNYQPVSGHWQDYVLAPASHTLYPVAVFAEEPREGLIQGNAAALLDGKRGAVTLTSLGDRTKSPLLILDFGQDVGGKISMKVLSASMPRAGLHLCFSESRQYMALSPNQNEGETKYAPGCDTANDSNGLPGVPYLWDSDSHRMPLAGAKLPANLTDPQIRGGFRYLTVFLDRPGSVEIGGVSLKFTAAPLQAHPDEYAGYFLSSDNELNKIWYAGAYTTQLNTVMPNTLKGNISAGPAASCWPYQKGEEDHSDGILPSANQSQEVIFDGAKRDRDPFTGDMSVEVPVTEVTTWDQSGLTNTLNSFARQQLADGFVPGNGLQCPNETEYFSGSYDLQFVVDVYQYILFSGDRDFLRNIYPVLVKAMAWADQQMDSSGLLTFSKYDKQGACGLYAYSSCDHLTYVNALYYETLKDMSEFARFNGREADVAKYESTALRLRGTINQKLWNASAGAYEMSPEHPQIFPQDANSVAVMTGIASQEQADSALDFLRKHEWSRFGSLTSPAGTPSAILSPEYEPLPSWFEVTARFSDKDAESARVDSGFQLMKTFWGYMLSEDPGSAFWEKVDTQGKPAIGSFTSFAHGWAAGPTLTLTTQVLGVSPTQPGYATYSVQPHPGSLAWAQGAMPTPHGLLRVRWFKQDGKHRFRMEVTSPVGTMGTLWLPFSETGERLAVDGNVVWANGRGTAGTRLHIAKQHSYISVAGLASGHHVLTVVGD